MTVEAIDITVDLDKRVAGELFDQINRAERVLGKSHLQSLKWGARLLCQSIGAQTKQTRAKLRRVVRNPDRRWMTDSRRAPFGVMRYKQGEQVFLPIYRTGEYGKNRFFDRKSMAWYDRSTGQWRKIVSGADAANPDIIIPSINDSPKRKIPFRGLAKKTWAKARSMISRGGNAPVLGRTNVAGVFLYRSRTEPYIVLSNRVSYATRALKSGTSVIDTALGNAARRMEHRIGQLLEQKMGAR